MKFLGLNHSFRLRVNSRKFSVSPQSIQNTILEERQAENNWIRHPECSVLLEKLIASDDIPSECVVGDDISHHLSLRGVSESIINPGAFRILSSLVTNPLTLSYGLRRIFPHQTMTNIKVSAIGMRSESQLPVVNTRGMYVSHCLTMSFT